MVAVVNDWPWSIAKVHKLAPWALRASTAAASRTAAMSQSHVETTQGRLKSVLTVPHWLSSLPTGRRN